MQTAKLGMIPVTCILEVFFDPMRYSHPRAHASPCSMLSGRLSALLHFSPMQTAKLGMTPVSCALKLFFDPMPYSHPRAPLFSSSNSIYLIPSPSPPFQSAQIVKTGMIPVSCILEVFIAKLGVIPVSCILKVFFFHVLYSQGSLLCHVCSILPLFFPQIAKLGMIPVSCVLEVFFDRMRYSQGSRLSVLLVLIGVATCTIADSSLSARGMVAAAVAVCSTALQQYGSRLSVLLVLIGVATCTIANSGLRVKGMLAAAVAVCSTALQQYYVQYLQKKYRLGSFNLLSHTASHHPLPFRISTHLLQYAVSRLYHPSPLHSPPPLSTPPQYVQYLQKKYRLGSFDLLSHTAPVQAGSLVLLGPLIDWLLSGARVDSYDFSVPSVVSAFCAPVQAGWLVLLGPLIDWLLPGVRVDSYDFSATCPELTGSLPTNATHFMFLCLSLLSLLFRLANTSPLCIGLSCLIAVAVNASQFICIGRFTALTFQGLGHMKTLSVLVLGYALFGLDGLNAPVLMGMLLSIMGMVWYGNASSRPGGKEKVPVAPTLPTTTEADESALLKSEPREAPVVPALEKQASDSSSSTAAAAAAGLAAPAGAAAARGGGNPSASGVSGGGGQSGAFADFSQLQSSLPPATQPAPSNPPSSTNAPAAAGWATF
ncbi:unnamed protein product [Closterium sp. NIES-64]|nr:unnamed protein product [Closterium sp. NIES-64]